MSTELSAILTGSVHLGESGGEKGFELSLRFAGGPAAMTLRSTSSFSLEEMWTAINQELQKCSGTKLPSVPKDGPWKGLFSAEIYPSVWITPRKGAGLSSYLELRFANGVPIGGDYHIGPVKITVEPHFTVDWITIGYDAKKGLNVSAAVTMPTRKLPSADSGNSLAVTTIGGNAKSGKVRKIITYPFPIPAQNPEKTLKIHYLGLGQRVGPNPVVNVPDPLATIFNRIEKNFTTNDPKDVLTDLAKNFYHPDRGWFIAADIEIKTFRIRVLFNDPALYGLELTVGDTPPSLFSGFKFEILYQKLGPNLGVYFAAVNLPTHFRQVPVGPFILILPGFSIWVYTNGDFRVNVGWPLGPNSIGLSWKILTGWIGFYFAKLRSGDNPGAQPNTHFNPILAIGLGFRLNAGVSVNKGLLSASMLISVTITMQGLLAWKADNTAIAGPPDAYWFAGSIDVHVLLHGAVDFTVIKVSVTISLGFQASIALENGYGTELVIHAHIKAKASIKILFVTVHFSFGVTVTHAIELASGEDGMAKVSGPQQSGLTGIISPDSRTDTMLTALHIRNAQAFKEEMAPLMRGEDELLVPPSRLAPDLRPRGRARVATEPGMAPTTRATPEMIFTTTAIQPLVIPVHFVLQSTVVYPSADSNCAASFAVVALLLTGGRDPNEEKTEQTRTAFENLVSRLVCWLLNDYAPVVISDELLSTRLNVIRELLDPKNPSKKTPFPGALEFAKKLKNFFSGNINFVIQGVTDTMPPAETAGAVLPMFDVLTLTVAEQKTIDFGHYNPLPANYQQAVDLYFDGLGIFGKGPSDDQGPATEAVMATGPGFTSYMFADYYLMLMRRVIGELYEQALAYEKKHGLKLKDAMEGVDPRSQEATLLQLRASAAYVRDTDHQSELDDLLENYDYASTAGFASRSLLGGQRLLVPSKVPNPVTSKNIHSVPVEAVYVLSGQQVNVTASGDTPRINAVLKKATGQDVSWIILKSAGTQPQTALPTVPSAIASIGLPKRIPPAPVPTWRGNGLKPLQPGLKPSGEDGEIQYMALDAITSVDLVFTNRNQSVWNNHDGAKQAIVQLPTPLQAMTSARRGTQVRLHNASKASPNGLAHSPSDQQGVAALLLDLPVTQIRRETVDDDSGQETVGVVKYLYQIGATDDTSREYIDTLLQNESATLDIAILYPADKNDDLTSDHLDPSVLITRVNLSTQNQAREVDSLAMLATENAKPEQNSFGLLTEPKKFLRLIWEQSVVNANGFYLFYRTTGGKGLPDRLFAESSSTQGGNTAKVLGSVGGTAMLRILVRLATSPSTIIPLPSYATAVVTPSLLKDTVALEVLDANNQPLPSWHSAFGAGDLGFRLNWKDQNTKPPQPGGMNPAELYHLLQFAVPSTGTENPVTTKVWSLPLNPFQPGAAKPGQSVGTTPKAAEMYYQKDDGATQAYQQVFPAYRFLGGERCQASHENVYALVGKSVAVQFRMADMFGNALPAQASASRTGLYHDPIINISQWPFVDANHYFTVAGKEGSENADAALLIICLSFNSQGLSSLEHDNGSNGGQQFASLANRYALIADQIADAGTTFQLASSLAPTGSIQADIRGDLATFVAAIRKEVDGYQNGMVVQPAGKPTVLQHVISRKIPFTNIVTLSQNILSVSVEIVGERQAKHAVPDIEQKMPEVIESRFQVLPRGRGFPGTPSAPGTQYCPLDPDPRNPGNPGGATASKTAITDYARYFEAAFTGFNGGDGKLKIAERAGLSTDAEHRGMQTLWAVRFAGKEGSTPGITVHYDGSLAFYALPPLNTEPVSRTVGDTTYNNIDMDAWSRESFTAIDQLFEPKLAVAITLLDQKHDPQKKQGPLFHRLSEAKHKIAKAVPQKLQRILQGGEEGDLSAACGQLEQAMLEHLSVAYTVSTVMQAKAAVATRDGEGHSILDGAGKAPEFTGQFAPPQARNHPADFDLLDSKSNTSKIFNLSTGRLEIKDGPRWSTVLVTVTEPREHAMLSMPLGFDIAFLQHDFIPSSTDYTPSSWLKFVLPDDQTLHCPVTLPGQPARIPIPLPFEPKAPMLEAQRAFGTKMKEEVTSFGDLIKKALKWTYQVNLKADIAAQDTLYFDAIFGATTSSLSSELVTQKFDEKVFDAMANFLKDWPSFRKRIPKVMKAAYGTNGDRSSAVATVTKIIESVENLAAAWTPDDGGLASLELMQQTQEIIHYSLSMKSNNDDTTTVTLGGRSQHSDTKPSRWPVIEFDSLSKWQPNPGDAIKKVIGGQTWWMISKSFRQEDLSNLMKLLWSELDLRKQQSGRFKTWTVRNAELVPGTTTNHQFIYETNLVSFSTPGIPDIQRTNLKPVTPKVSLYEVLMQILTPLAIQDTKLAPFVRITTELRYTVAELSSASTQALNATIPYVLQPNLVLGSPAQGESPSGSVTPTAAAQLTGAIQARHNAFKGGQAKKVYLDLGITLFGSEQGQQVPLVTIDPLSLDVSAVEADWWAPPK